MPLTPGFNLDGRIIISIIVMRIDLCPWLIDNQRTLITRLDDHPLASSESRYRKH
jgi:hypothetical protein